MGTRSPARPGGPLRLRTRMVGISRTWERANCLLVRCDWCVVCLFTAFVAVDSRHVAEGAERHRVLQPVVVPAGWDMFAIRSAVMAAPSAMFVACAAPPPPTVGTSPKCPQRLRRSTRFWVCRTTLTPPVLYLSPMPTFSSPPREKKCGTKCAACTQRASRRRRAADVARGIRRFAFDTLLRYS